MSGKKPASAKRSAGSGAKRSAGSSKKSADGGGAGAAAPLTIETMTREQLIEEVKKYQTEVNKEREERNFFQVERDRVVSFWDITKNELEECRAQILNKDRDIEEIEEKHQTEVKVYKQKVKHLLYEYQNNVENLQTAHTEALHIAGRDYDGEHEQLRRERRALKLELREKELAHEDVVRQLKARQDMEVNALRQDFERRAAEIMARSEYKMRAVREDTELRRKAEIHEIEERKNGQINALMKSHEKAFADIKNYYNDITLNNLALINSLKEQVEEMKKKEERNEKLMSDISAENKRLSEPLQAALSEGEQLRRQLTHYKKDKLALQNAQARLRVLTETHRTLSWDNDILAQKFAEVTDERNELYAQFMSRVAEAQQKAGFRNLVLEKKLDSLRGTLEKRELEVRQTLASGMSPTPAVAEQNARAADKILDSKNAQIRQLQLDLAKATKAHNELLRTFEGKMAEYGICVDEFKLKPLRWHTSHSAHTTGASSAQSRDF